MSRVALTKPIKIVVATVAVVALLGGGAWAYVANSPAHQVEAVTNSQNQLTQISYRGEQGVDALTLLKQHATVGVKHYSFGDLVTSIDGSAGNGPKYWTFYINGQEAQVGAGSYKTKDSDTLKWKLQ